MVSMIVHRKDRKDIKKRTLKKPVLHRKSFSQKSMPKIVSMGYTEKLLKKLQTKIAIKNHFQKK